MTGTELKGHIQRMLAMLNDGQFLRAFDEFYRHDAHFFENEFLFAESAAEARERQASFLETCSDFSGSVELVHMDLGRGISVFYNRSSYEHEDYGQGRINGVHVQYWQEDSVAREEYFSGDRADEMLTFWRQVSRTAGL